MRFDQKDPPRTFSVGNSVKFDMHDCGTVALAPDEQVTFVTEGGGEYDVSRKSWGFYATPSLNARMLSFGLRGVLIRNKTTRRYFMFLVEADKDADFNAYMEQEGLEIVAWMDSTEALDKLRSAMMAAS